MGGRLWHMGGTTAKVPVCRAIASSKRWRTGIDAIPACQRSAPDSTKRRKECSVRRTFVASGVLGKLISAQKFSFLVTLADANGGTGNPNNEKPSSCACLQLRLFRYRCIAAFRESKSAPFLPEIEFLCKRRPAENPEAPSS